MSSQKKTKLSHDMLGMVSSDKDSRPSKHTKKKKKSKTQSPRTETTSAFSSESDISSKKKKKKKKKMSQMDDDDVDEVNAIEYNGDENERGNNCHKAPTRKKKNRKKKISQEMLNENGNIYALNDHAGSVMGSSKVSPSKKHNERVRNDRQPQPMHIGSHHDNGYVEYDHDDYMSEMGNNDPADGYGQGYDMEEDDEEEPRFKYSTADLANNSCRNTNCCLAVAVAFFILIAIAGSILLVKLQKNDDTRRLLLRGAF